jgi:hypothetical protein
LQLGSQRSFYKPSQDVILSGAKNLGLLLERLPTGIARDVSLCST